MNYRVRKGNFDNPIIIEKDISRSASAVLMFLGCAGSIYILLMAWVFFFPPARVERVKIAVHDQQTFKKIQAKHGKAVTGMVIYEKDGKAWYYKDGQKIKFQ